MDVTGARVIEPRQTDLFDSGKKIDTIADSAKIPINVPEDRLDAYPDFVTKICNIKKERKRITVPYCADELMYNTNHIKRGIAVIFNHENFDMATLKQRNGTEADCQNLERTFQLMGFEVQKYLDLTFKEVDAVLDYLSTYDHSDCDCLLICVLSHGEQNTIYAKNMCYSTNVLFDRFTPDRCPSLAGKPKLFVIQACQGDKLDCGIDVEIDKLDSGTHTYKIPLYADYLIAYSTIPGYFSWRNTQKGSWFIQAFCEEMNKYWTEFDFVSILSFINRRVAYDFESNVPTNQSMHRQKQIPSFTVQLTRLLKFSPKNIENNRM
ncbi:hypothetical protein PGB90_003561 [Kerria lacca]